MATKKTHYEILGIAQTASVEEIRRAYRGLVRQHHPDLSVDASHESISRINEAWSVLSQPASRRSYDLTLRLSFVQAPVDEPKEYEPISFEPARFPWRGLLGAAVIAIVFVLVAHAFASPPVPRKPDQLLEPGSCVNVDTSRFVFEVMCTETHDAKVVQFIPTDRTCPLSTERYQDRQGMGIACVVRTDVSTQAPPPN